MKPSGRVRWRSQRSVWGRDRLVLQLEWTGTRPEHMGSFITMEDHTEWRDASAEDMWNRVLVLVETTL